MAKLKCNLDYVHTGWGNLKMMNFEIMEILRRFKCEGLDPDFQMFTAEPPPPSYENDSETVAYQSVPIESMEWNTTASNAAPEGSVPENKSHICQTCGQAYKTRRQLIGHIRFKHERNKWLSSK